MKTKQEKIINYFCHEELRYLGYSTQKVKKYNKKKIIKDLKIIYKKFNFSKKYNKYVNYKKLVDLIN